MPDLTTYSIDTNVLMDWQARYYPTDVFTTMSGRIDALVAAGRWQASALVLEELNIMAGAAPLSMHGTSAKARNMKRHPVSRNCSKRSAR